MRASWRAFWREPRPAGAPPAGRSDWLLVAAFEVAAVVEAFVRPGLAWQPFVTLLAMAVIPLLLWRRSHPRLTCLIGFGVAGLLSAVQLLTHSGDIGSSAMLVILVLLYSLVRWGSGREIVLGIPWVAAVVALGMYAASVGLAELVGGTLLLLLIAAVAAVFRSRADVWQRQRREIRTEERLALARELHDTVAHHVSAIAVQAQAGGLIVQSQPALAARVLATIDAEARRTLAEMRAMVSVLRDDGSEAYTPLSGVADLAALARSDAKPIIDVSLTGNVAGLPRPVDAAVYRIAQESLTNALRHARSATRVDIALSRLGNDVTLRVSDDGLPDPGSPAPRGFGLTGMAERAHLLGGTFSAGPSSRGGWVAEAVLPVEIVR